MKKRSIFVTMLLATSLHAGEFSGSGLGGGDSVERNDNIERVAKKIYSMFDHTEIVDLKGIKESALIIDNALNILKNDPEFKFSNAIHHLKSAQIAINESGKLEDLSNAEIFDLTRFLMSMLVDAYSTLDYESTHSLLPDEKSELNSFYIKEMRRDSLFKQQWNIKRMFLLSETSLNLRIVNKMIKELQVDFPNERFDQISEVKDFKDESLDKFNNEWKKVINN